MMISINFIILMILGKLENDDDLHDRYDDCILMYDGGFLKFEHCQGDPGAE